jgi:hypothetical protein
MGLHARPDNALRLRGSGSPVLAVLALWEIRVSQPERDGFGPGEVVRHDFMVLIGTEAVVTARITGHYRKMMSTRRAKH